MGRIIGFESKCFLGSQQAGTVYPNNLLRFGVKDFKRNSKGDPHEVGDSRGGYFKDYRTGRIGFEMDLTAYLDDTIYLQDQATYDLSMIDMAKGYFVDFAIWTKGVSNKAIDPTYGAAGTKQGAYIVAKNLGVTDIGATAGTAAAGRGLMVESMEDTGSVDKPVEFNMKGKAAGYFREPVN